MGVTDSDVLYVSDFLHHRVQRWMPGASVGITVAGGNGAGTGLHQLRNPNGLFVTADGDVYVADSGNHRVVKWRAGVAEGVIVAEAMGEVLACTNWTFPWM